MKQMANAKPEPILSTTAHNVKVNRDRDPWPKAEVAVGVDPKDGNVVVMTNDFRENRDRLYTCNLSVTSVIEIFGQLR
jgi:hypothetical protein